MSQLGSVLVTLAFSFTANVALHRWIVPAETVETQKGAAKFRFD